MTLNTIEHQLMSMIPILVAETMMLMMKPISESQNFFADDKHQYLSRRVGACLILHDMTADHLPIEHEIRGRRRGRHAGDDEEVRRHDPQRIATKLEMRPLQSGSEMGTQFDLPF